MCTEKHSHTANNTVNGLIMFAALFVITCWVHTVIMCTVHYWLQNSV